ncbi:MAG TPA: SMEK domain-containing protein, partial [Verrucomicrobiales bacterium]|nr:SMEK domain-containing protein [Verrucomicrobiales bacterium]
MFDRQQLLTAILQRLSIMETCLKWHSSRGLNDACKVAEDVVARFLGALCGWNLVNLNTIRPNYPAADLGDAANRLAVQVTVNGTAQKIKETCDKARDHQLSQDFDRLIVLFLLPKAPAMPQKSKTFDPAGPPALELWAHPEINRALDKLTTVEALQAVLDVLQREMSGIEAILTPVSQEDPSTILKLLREGLPKVRARTGGHLEITPPR